MTVRVRKGAPNEARFGFSQAVRRGRRIAVSGQVGKDNATGEMVAGELVPQLRQAVANVREAARLAGSDPPALVSLTVHLTGPLEAATAQVRRALGDDAPCALTVVRVPALSHDAYLAELSATSTTTAMAELQRLDPGPHARLPWAPAAVVDGDDVHVGACHGDGAPGPALAEALEVLRDVLARAGCGLEDVLGEHAYVVQPIAAADFDAICEAHRGAYGSAPPASTLVLVDELPGGARVAVTAVARRP
jgi:enamine deaminase RidA (YjgF/YER057c/UK114 family)